MRPLGWWRWLAGRRYTWLRCASDGVAHAVTDRSFRELGVIDGVPARCGHQVVVELQSLLLLPTPRRCGECRMKLPRWGFLFEHRYRDRWALADALMPYALFHPQDRGDEHNAQEPPEDELHHRHCGEWHR